ncbi:unnamed protein product [Pseudo-nitzschia multistriata]|uniref:RING-type domain-containing protein n=1 Tax=Pseudo-nitzschia multistriata TaxID=183589 RepID=A0A448ZSD5_9STRA|nr:unnamed protein product [Pseudo-nitzschia multistriata]
MPKPKQRELASMENITSPAPSLSSPEVKKRSRKRRIQSREERSPRSRSKPRSSKKGRKSRKDDLPPSCLFSLTPNAVELMAMGIDLFDRRHEGPPGKPSKSNASKAQAERDRVASAESASSAIDGNSAHSRRNELVLRLRVDLPPPVPESVPGKEQTPVAKNPNSENNGEQAALYGTLGDGRSTIRAMVLNPDGIWSKRLERDQAAAGIEGKEASRKIDWIVMVHGYASTEKFWHTKYQIFPVICLTSISILHTCAPKKSFSPLGKPLFSKGVGLATSFKAQAGTIGTFLKERGPFLTNEELAGSSRIRDPKTESLAAVVSNDENNPETSDALLSSLKTSADQNFKKVHDCLSRHSAMLTLQQSSSVEPLPSALVLSGTSMPGQSSSTDNEDSSSDPPVPSDSPSKTRQPTQHAWELYNGTLREFRTSQMDRQKASLGTNTGRESAERAELVVTQHNAALELALKEEGPLSVELLVKWHKELLRGLHPEAGEIRTRTVRCGHTVFCPPKQIENQLELYCAGLKSLELRLDMANNALHVVLFAAVAMFGIVDIHPFIDGNGRLSRIVANYALKWVPFPINLFATPAQRNEYVVAIERTRHVLSANCSFGDVSRDDLVQVIKYTGVFGALVELLMDRVARAGTTLAALWEEKSGLAAEAAEAKAARRVRERASRGTCMICLDEKPNIATLCCGNAIHLNCCAEWLSGNNRCPICRHEMPSISGRVVRAMEEPRERYEEENEDGDTDGTGGQNPEIFERDYQNVVERFWTEVRQGSRTNRANRSNPSFLEFFDSTTTLPEDTGVRLRFNDESSGSSESDSDDDVVSLHRLRNNARTRARGNNMGNRSTVNPDIQNIDETTTDSSESIDQGGEHDATTTIVGEEDAETEDNLDTTTTTVNESESNTTTTTDDSDSHSQEPRRHEMSMICASSSCRNRPALGCTNNLCGRCCVLIGNWHCPRHNS